MEIRELIGLRKFWVLEPLRLPPGVVATAAIRLVPQAAAPASRLPDLPAMGASLDAGLLSVVAIAVHAVIRSPWAGTFARALAGRR